MPIDFEPRLTDRYFELSSEIERGKAAGDYAAGIRAARETYSFLPEFVEEWTHTYGSFDIVTSHAVHTASGMMAVMGEREGIDELRRVLQRTPKLHRWLPVAEQAERDAELVVALLHAVGKTPGLLQSDAKHTVGQGEGRRISTLATWLEKTGRLKRVRAGSKIRLYPASYTVPMEASTEVADRRPATIAKVKAGLPAARVRARRPPSIARELELAALPYLRLPRAPHRWEERQERVLRGLAEGCQRESGMPTHDSGDHFIAGGRGWKWAREEKLSADQRPDPAYKEVFPTVGSTFWLDPKGRRADFPESPAVLRATDRNGVLLAEAGLAYDTYRADVNTHGSAILFLSRNGVLHGYTDHIETILTDHLYDVPEYRAQASRLGIDLAELKNHVRCVAISADCTWYVVTIVDEAWAFTTVSGEVRWGLRFPRQDGWTKVIAPHTDRRGSSAEVQAALDLMVLSMPVTPEAITKRYRLLAMQWHPDRNPEDSAATARFQALGSAMELLTGARMCDVQYEDLESVTYRKVLHQVEVGHGLSMTLSMVMGEKQVADWIYAANCGLEGDRAFLAGYSGRVVELSGGVPQRVIDIGSVPRQVVETGSHVYILTDTRLYVLSGEQLEGLVDVFDKGRLIVGRAGFGLLQSKAFSWYTPTGEQMGQVTTRDPIRRVLSTREGLVVETRQHRGVIEGAPSWWEP